MSLVSEIASYWNNNSTLTNAAGSLYLGFVPDATAYPYATVTIISDNPTWITGSSYFTQALVQFNIYSDSAATVDSIMSTVQTAFDWQAIAGATIMVARENGYLMEDEHKVYQGIIEYRIASQRSL